MHDFLATDTRKIDSSFFCLHKIEMEPAWKLKLDSDEVIMADDTTRDLSSLMSKIKQTTEFQKQHSNTSNTEDNNDVSDTRVSF